MNEVNEMVAYRSCESFGLVAAVMTACGLYAFFPGLRDGVDPFFLVFAVVMLALGALYGWAYLHRSTPVVRVTDEAIEYGSPFAFRRHGRVPLRSVRRVEPLERGLRLETTDGRVDLPLHDLEPSQHRALREALASRLPTGGAG